MEATIYWGDNTAQFHMTVEDIISITLGTTLLGFLIAIWNII